MHCRVLCNLISDPRACLFSVVHSQWLVIGWPLTAAVKLLQLMLHAVGTLELAWSCGLLDRTIQPIKSPSITAQLQVDTVQTVHGGIALLMVQSVLICPASVMPGKAHLALSSSTSSRDACAWA